MYKIKKRKRLLLFVMTFFIMFGSALECAASTTQSIRINPSASYTYWEIGSARKEVVDCPAFEIEAILDGRSLSISGFNGIADICGDEDGKLYILDANRRIVILDEQQKFYKEIETFTYNGETLSFSEVNGIYVDTDKKIYIADTDNQRVIRCDENGKVEKIFTKPKSDLIPDDLKYLPIRIAKDQRGFLYILLRGSYYGALVYDEQGSFLGFFGANRVQGINLDAFFRTMKRIINNNARAQYQQKKLPNQFADLYVDADGFLYTVSPTGDKRKSQLNKLSPTGTNILYHKFGNSPVNATDFNFGMEVFYKNINDVIMPEGFSGVAVDHDGFIYTLDTRYGRIYVYDQECNVISAFGGGLGQGNQKGVFYDAVAVETLGGKLFVADKERNAITVFRKTDYGSLIMEAQKLTLAGEYEQASPLWEKAIASSSNCQLAYRGLAKASVLSEKYDEAIAYAKLGYDQDSYAQAFEQKFNKLVSDNIVWILIAAMVILGCVLVVIVLTTRKKLIIVKNDYIRTCLHTVTHPFYTFYDIKYRNKGSLLIAAIIAILYYTVEILKILCGGFMYTVTVPNKFNALYVLIGTAGVVLLWSVVNWAVSTLVEGKGRLKEIFISTSYSLLPVLFSGVFYIVFSHIIVPSTSSILSLFNTISWVFTVILLIIGMMTIHEFDFLRAVWTGILTIIGILLIIFIVFMVLTFAQNFIAFIVNLVMEVLTRQ